MTTQWDIINCHEANPDWGSGEIARHLGCSGAQVRATADRRGLKLGKFRGSSGPWARMSKSERYEAIKRRAAEGQSLQEVAASLGCSKSSIYDILSMMGTNWTDLKGGRSRNENGISDRSERLITLREVDRRQKDISGCDELLERLQKYHPEGGQAHEYDIPPELSEAAARRNAERFERVQRYSVSGGNCVLAEA